MLIKLLCNLELVDAHAKKHGKEYRSTPEVIENETNYVS